MMHSYHFADERTEAMVFKGFWESVSWVGLG